MAQPYLSLKRAKTLLVEVVETSPPGKRNGTANEDTSVCAYLNDKGERCIVGEMLHRLGMPKPHEVGFGLAGNRFVSKGYMTKATKNWLQQVQTIFDDGQFTTVKRDGVPHGFRFRPITWRSALAKVRKKGLL